MAASYRIVIRFVSGSRAGENESFPMAQHESLYVGRDPGCDIRFDLTADDVVSRSHALIEWDEESDPPRCTVTDLLSSNGTYVDGDVIEAVTPLIDGSLIEFGKGGPSLQFGLETVIESDHSDALVDFANTRVTRQVPSTKKLSR